MSSATDSTIAAASALVTALAALTQAKASVERALGILQSEAPPADGLKTGAAVRTTSVQILHALTQSSDPMSLAAIAESVVAIRRGEDQPKGGGTRYQEMCRSSLKRLIAQGVVERVEPTSKHDLMRFRRVNP
jgi:hypothetical protein